MKGVGWLWNNKEGAVPSFKRGCVPATFITIPKYRKLQPEVHDPTNLGIRFLLISLFESFGLPTYHLRGDVVAANPDKH